MFQEANCADRQRRGGMVGYPLKYATDYTPTDDTWLPSVKHMTENCAMCGHNTRSGDQPSVRPSTVHKCIISWAGRRSPLYRLAKIPVTSSVSRWLWR